ncbi:MAG: deoxyribonuclease IV [Thermoanaerobaculia bacterium]
MIRAPMPLLGAHVSASGGMPRAVERAARAGYDTLQLFVKSPRQWRARPLARGEAGAFREALRASPVSCVLAHGTYLVNLAATDRETLRRSRSTLGVELGKCQTLGIPALVVHPGAHLGRGVEEGIRAVAASLAAVLARRRGRAIRLLLENTAGQGTMLGWRLEQLAAMRQLSGHPQRVGFCIDTCHAFAAGYRLNRAAGWEEFAGELDRHLGLTNVACLHLNDSRHAAGSRRDRHANIGRGRIGHAAFARLLNDPRLAGLPMILETPLGEDGQGHRRDFALLRRLAAD